jgi:hypothetical protein
MGGKIQQCVCIKFCMKLSKSSTKTFEMLHMSFKEHSLSSIVVFEWHSRFMAGQLSVEEERSGRSDTSKMTENVEKLESSSTKTIAEQ